jgi:hypothetical protein
MGFGLVIGFMGHLYTQLISTSNYNSLAGLHTQKITVTAAHTNLLSSLVISW